MNLKNLNIGIWGTGVVGISAYRFFKKQGASVSIYDAHPIAAETLKIYGTDVHIYKPDEQELFLSMITTLFPSPGVAYTEYKLFTGTILYEVDIFFSLYEKPVIAVTGTLGKTTITYALQSLLQSYGYHVQIGGNVGIALLDLIDTQQEYDYTIIELSSFQLEHARIIKPTLAIWTNLYPNHLDRHGTMDNYFRAKLPIIAHQDEEDRALLHESVKPYISLWTIRSTITYFSSTMPAEVAQLVKTYHLHPEHYMILFMVAKLLKLNTNSIGNFFSRITAPEHRITFVGSYKGAYFYDDSKSTVIEATHGALQRFADKQVILFVGGISKGVSREHFFKELGNHIKHICFFGKEAGVLKRQCDRYLMRNSAHATLEEAFEHAITLIEQEDIILFSPGGASFDLFTDYKQRGKRFQELVKQKH